VERAHFDDRRPYTAVVSDLVVGAYASRPVSVAPPDPRAPDVAAAVADLVVAAVPDGRVEHVGSTAVTGMPGTGIVDLLVLVADGQVTAAGERLARHGFQRPAGARRHAAHSPALVGSVDRRGRRHPIHLYVMASSDPEVREIVGFRDVLRGDPRLRRAYAVEKRRLVDAGVVDPHLHVRARSPFIDAVLDRLRIRLRDAPAGRSSRATAMAAAMAARPPGAPRPAAPAGPRAAGATTRGPAGATTRGPAGATTRGPAAPAGRSLDRSARAVRVPASEGPPDRVTPILPPATIGILGGGQLGRMIAMAARAMGYRIAILDPDPDCPARPVADRQVVGRYDDAAAAAELARGCAVVTYELEHVDAALGEAVLAAGVPLRPGLRALTVAQDRIAERRWVEEQDVPVARWREVRSVPELRVALGHVGLPARLKAPLGGYDGRSQVRIVHASAAADAWAALSGPLASRDPRLPPGSARTHLLVESELPFIAELSVVVARGGDRVARAFPVARNVHDDGILVESMAPAPVAPLAVAFARDLGERLAAALDVVGTLTVEMFLLPDDTLAVNELAPRVHNSGHWTIEGCRTSQFEQHVRAICGLPLGSIEMTGSAATVNLLGTGPDRPAHLTGLADALADPEVKVHLYDKRRVFERRKMGHVTAVGGSPEAALEHARHARTCLRWGR
jgi:5-(carboxyamino)imidazole ribonucleotide synthase